MVDNGSVATPLHQSILDALELLETGCSAAEVKSAHGSGEDQSRDLYCSG